MSRWPYSTSTWQRLRQAKLSTQPICEACERRGRTVLARHVDHIVEISMGGPAFPPLDGLMSMCVSCHTIKTNAVKSGKGAKFRGCDVDGNPLDPDDDWHATPHSAADSGVGDLPQPESGETLEAADSLPCPAQRPAGFAGRRKPTGGTMGESKTELVTANDSQQGNSLWV